MARKATREKEGWVFLKRDAAGNWRAKWYGRWMVNGKTRETSLCAWQGIPPDNPAKDTGTAAFERSRERARIQLKAAIEGRRDADEELRDAQKIHALRYGERVTGVKIRDLAAKWDDLPHKTDLSEERRKRVHSVLKFFHTFMETTFPRVKDAGALTAEHFKAFLDAVDKRGVSARSWNDYLSILRGVLAKVDGQGRGFREYLALLPKRVENTIHRRPFSGDELEAIITAAGETDEELRPVLVAAACTALRRGDVCRLRWDAVDLAGGFVTVKTSKTGETVEIPIFPPFRVVLEEAARKRRRGGAYIWPEIARTYAESPDALNQRLGKVLALAGFIRPRQPKKNGAGDGKTCKKKKEGNAGKYEAPKDAALAMALVEDGMMRANWTGKRQTKARRILELHFQGLNGREIAEEIGTSAGAVSEYLHAMEDVGQVAIVSPPKIEIDPARTTLAEVRDGEKRKQRGSLCGWHSFRTTFCTLALANGVPMDILRKITGHRTAEIVLKHYDRRGREEMRKTFGAAMPKAISGVADGKDGEGSESKRGRGRRGRENAEEHVTPLPPGLAALLDKATPEQLQKVAEMLKEADNG